MISLIDDEQKITFKILKSRENKGDIKLNWDINNSFFSCSECQEINSMQPCEACSNYRKR